MGLSTSTEYLTDTMNVNQKDDEQQQMSEELQQTPVIDVFDNNNNIHVFALHQEFMRLGLSNTKKYVAAGNAETNIDIDVTENKTPVFWQNGTQMVLFSSLASGLMHLNDKKASDFILQHTEPSEEASDAIGCALMLLTRKELRYSAKLYKSGMGRTTNF